MLLIIRPLYKSSDHPSNLILTPYEIGRDI